MDNLTDLAQTVHDIEHQGAELTRAWYLGSTGSDTDLKHLQNATTESIKALQELSDNLNERLLSTPENDRQTVQYAYNLVQELLQSRQANDELLNSLLEQQNSHFSEYYRALSVKEKAAEQQAEKLLKTVQKLH